MTIGFITTAMFICLVCRCFMFYKRDISWKKAFIPGYNKYLIGKSCEAKKLGVINGIMQPILHIYFYFCFGFELWIIQNYSTQATIPTDINDSSQFQVMVPENIANIAIYSKYGLIALALICLVVWCMMMWKFTMVHKRSPWWILLWASIPVIPYCFFAASNDVYIDKKIYTMKRVEKT